MADYSDNKTIDTLDSVSSALATGTRIPCQDPGDTDKIVYTTPGGIAEAVYGDDDNAFTDSEKSKLAGIESGATGDQTGSEIKALYEAQSNTNVFTDAEKTKLSGVELEADVTDAVNVAAAGALMAANNLSDIPTPATARTNLGLGDSVILPLSSLDPAYYSRAAVPYIGGYAAASDRITLVYPAGTIVVGSDYLSLITPHSLILNLRKLILHGGLAIAKTHHTFVENSALVSFFYFNVKVLQ